KSAACSCIAIHVAKNHQGAVLFVSLEMNERELCDRALCAESRVSAYRMRDGSINQDDRMSLVEASARLSHLKIFIDDAPSRTVTEICAAARRTKRKHGLSLVVIDYLQLIVPDNPK